MVVLTNLICIVMFIWIIVKSIQGQMENSTKIDEEKPLDYELLKELGIINTNKSNGGIVVPDNVHTKNSTQKSTQNIDCKKYGTPISFERKVEKIVVENDYKSTKNTTNTTKTYQTSKIEDYNESVYEDDNEDPIQENPSFFSRLFGSKIERL